HAKTDRGPPGIRTRQRRRARRGGAKRPPRGARAGGLRPAPPSRSVLRTKAMDEREKDRPGPEILGVLPLPGTVLFPHAVVPLWAGRASSVRLLEEAVQSGRLVGAVLQREAGEDAPGRPGLHDVGTLTVIHKVLKQPDGTLRLVVQGLGRFRLGELVQQEPFLRARIESVPDDAPGSGDLESEALQRSAMALFEKIVTLSPSLPDELTSVAETAQG